MSKIKWPHEFPGVYWLDEKEESAVLDVLQNGSLFRYYGIGEPNYSDGKRKPQYVDEFENKAKAKYGCNHTLAINSGTGSLITAMRALDIGPGCEVMIPSFLWVATVGAIIQVGAIPVVCEIDDTFNVNAKDIESKITDKTKLIITIHMAGVPCDMDSIMAVADKHNIPVLEDCAQCNGGMYKGKSVGTFGKMGIFSLQLNKNMTSGEGGLLITDDEKLHLRAFSAHDMGLIRVDGRLSVPDEFAIMWGAGRRMNEMCGAVASVQIDKLDKITSSMRESKYRIRNMLKEISGITLRRIPDEDGDSGPFIIMMLDNEEKALNVAKKMKEAGLTSCHRVADYGLHIYSNILSLINKVPLSSAGNPWSLKENAESIYDYTKGACPRSDELFARSIVLPVPSCLTEELEKQAVDIITGAMK